MTQAPGWGEGWSKSAPRLPARQCPDARPVAALAEELEDSGRTAVLVLVDGQPLGVLGIADRLRPDVASLATFTDAAAILLTGDTPGPPGT